VIETVPIQRRTTLDDYASLVFLSETVRELRLEAAQLVQKLGERTVWMLNSTARGGGVAEMMPSLVGTLRDLGVRCEWIVMTPERPAFYELTRRLHDLIHGHGDAALGAPERELYDAVSRDVGAELSRQLPPDALLVVHDPQPMGAGAVAAAATGATAIWRCHIGLEQHTTETRAAWRFLEPHAGRYAHGIFTSAAYAPSFFASRLSVMPPSIDPLDHKNRELSPHKLVGVLCNSRLLAARAPVLTPPFTEPACRVDPDGLLRPADVPEDVELMYRPMVTQVSRWDRLKGFVPLLEGFAQLKRTRAARARSERDARRLEIVRLLLVGPAPGSIADDPEGMSAFRELVARYCELEPELQRDIALLVLPMSSRKRNAVMVNAIQRCSTIVVQNSLREGFGLTATEAMWKAVPVLVSNAYGLGLQVRDQLDGRVLKNPEDSQEVADTLAEMLADPRACDDWGRSAQRQVSQEFLLFRQVARMLRVLAGCAEGRTPSGR
jgi:trehalose synthase